MAGAGEIVMESGRSRDAIAKGNPRRATTFLGIGNVACNEILSRSFAMPRSRHERLLARLISHRSPSRCRRFAVFAENRENRVVALNVTTRRDPTRISFVANGCATISSDDLSGGGGGAESSPEVAFTRRKTLRRARRRDPIHSRPCCAIVNYHDRYAGRR